MSNFGSCFDFHRTLVGYKTRYFVSIIYHLIMFAWTSLVKIVMEPTFKEKKIDKHAKDILFRSTCGSTLLHFSIIGGNIETIQYLIKKGLSPTRTNFDGETPLHWACKEATPGIVSFLIQQGANVSAEDCEGNTPLHWAVEYNNLEIAKELIQAGAILDKKNIDNITPLKVAKLNGAMECISLLKSLLSPRKSKVRRTFSSSIFTPNKIAA